MRSVVRFVEMIDTLIVNISETVSLSINDKCETLGKIDVRTPKNQRVYLFYNLATRKVPCIQVIHNLP